MGNEIWQVWRDLLAGKVVPLHEGDAHCGFYRLKHKDGPPVGLAIYPPGDDDLAMFAVIHGEEGKGSEREVGDPDRLYSLFSRACRSPVSKATFDRYVADGFWPDMDRTAATIALTGQNGNGHNSGIDEVQQKVENLDELVAALNRYSEIADEETLTKVTGLRTSIAAIGTWLDKRRKAEGDPHFTLYKAVNAKFNPLIDRAETADKAAKALQDHYATKLLQQQRAEEERKRREAAEAEAKRKAEEEAAIAAAKEAATPDAIDEAIAAIKAQQETAPPPTAPETILPQRINTGLGRAASIRTKRIARIEDWEKVFPRYKNTAEVTAVFLKLVQADVDRGIIPPGVEVDEVADTRR